MRKANKQRRGVALLIAMVCIVLLGFLVVSVLRFTLLRRKAATVQMNRAQATCLADSGLRLATARLELDPDYSGETWEISSESLEGQYGATVVVEVKSTDKENIRLVKATADYPKDLTKRTRISKEIAIKFKHHTSDAK